MVIGNGTIQSGNFGSITWEADNYFLKVELDAQGGINYFNMGTVEFLSVPYALYAKNSGGILGGTNIGITSISSNGDTLYLSNGQIFVNSSGNSNGIFISSISSNGDTLHLSNGQTFVAGGNTNSGGGTGNLVLPTITTNAITGITSNSATFGGTIINANANQIMERGIVYSTSPNPTILSNKIIIGSGIGSFDTISGLGFNYAHLLSSNTTYYIRAYAITENNISAYGNEVSFTTLSIGQTGPSGGIVFFDKGNSNGGWQYLECPSYDQSTGIAWGCHGLSIPGTQLTVGSGEANTNLIVAGCNDASFAANLCDTLTLGGQNDWFLPSRDELNLMYKNLYQNGQGSFNTYNYISSTEQDSLYFWDFWIIYGSSSNCFKNQTSRIVRAVRAF